ncbi:hypothetical protein DsansV1_C08g0079961 [Dioscorea sansibarensis]
MHDRCIGKKSTVNDDLMNKKNQSFMVMSSVPLFPVQRRLKG